MIIIHMTFARIYRFGGVTFEWHNYLGPIVINRHTEKERGYKGIPLRNWSQINKFANMDDKIREVYRIN